MRYITDFIGPVYSRKHTVSGGGVQAAKGVYLGLYRHACLQLYANGLVNDPTFLNLQDVAKVLIEEGILPQSVHGKVNLSPEALLAEAYRQEFREGIAEADTDFPTYDARNWSGPYSGWEYPCIARMFYIALYLRDQVISLDEMHHEVAYSTMVSGKRVINFKVYHTKNDFRDKTKFRVTEAVLQSFCYPAKRMKRMSITETYWSYLYRLMGIEVEGRETALFVDGMSLEQEQSLFTLITTGGVDLDGEYGEDLKALLREKVWPHQEPDYTLLTYLQRESGDTFESDLYDVIEKVYDTPNVYYITPTSCILGLDVNTVPVTVGQACLSEDGGILDDANLFYNITGEFIDKDSLALEPRILKDGSEGEPVTRSVPTSILVDGRPKLMYDFEFALIASDMYKGSKSRFSSLGMEAVFSFEKNAPDTVLATGSVMDPVSALRLSYEGAESGHFGPIFSNRTSVKDMQQAVKSVMADLE